MFVLCISVCTTTANATEVWSDDFNDGNYIGWTICNNMDLYNGSYGFANSNWSATNNYLQLDQEDLGIITHPSSVAYGTWSFDFKTPETQLGMGTLLKIYFISNDHVLTTDDWDDPERTDIYIEFGVFTHEEPHNYTLILGKHYGGNETTIDTGKVPAASWLHFDVTRNTTGWISVYHNRSLDPIMEGEDTEIDTSEIFWLWFEERQMIDNIVIDNEVLNFASALPWELIAIGGGVAVVMIVFVIVIFRRR